MSGPHSKPVIFQYGEFGAWLIAWQCCPKLGPNEFFGGGGTWREAIDAALAHVAEVHTLDADLAAECAFWERHYADAARDLADDPMNTTHNGSRSDA